MVLSGRFLSPGARQAGLTSGAVYGNFADKQELMALAVLERGSELQHDLFSLAAGAGAGNETRVLLDHFVEHLAACRPRSTACSPR